MSDKSRKPPHRVPRIEGTTAGGAIVRSRVVDGFEVGDSRKQRVDIAPTSEVAAPVPRARTLDPRLIPVVPASVTSDAGRQFHALLGLPKRERPVSRERQGFDLEALLVSLTPARRRQIEQVLKGRPSPLKQRLTAFIEDPKFRALDFESQLRALAAFELRHW